MRKYRIDKQNGNVFILRVDATVKDGEAYKLWYKRNRLFSRWYFIGFADSLAVIEQTIHYHFGFTSMVHRIS